MPWLLLGFIGLVSCSDKNGVDAMADVNTTLVQPVCSVLSTCQKKSRVPGDDGHWQAGVYLSTEERFEDHDDGTFTDYLTGRMWMFALPNPDQIGYGEMVRSADGTGTAGSLFLKKHDVPKFLDDMNAGRFQSYGKGFSDWRWPSIVELSSLIQLVDINKSDDRQYFVGEFVKRLLGNARGSFTSSTDVHVPTGGNFTCSLVAAAKSVAVNSYPDACVVLVRSITATTNDTERVQAFVRLPAVGPREADLEAHKQWPDPRFEILPSGSEREAKDDVVMDNLSGLFWARNANPAGKKNWDDALKYCNEFKLGGYDDWRMPNVFEMLSIICYGLNSPALANTAGDSQWKEADPFLGVMNDLYWTSTAEEPRLSHSYVVNVKDGTLDTDYGQPIKSLLDHTLGDYPKHFVWPVRGGVLDREQKKKPRDQTLKDDSAEKPSA